MTVITNFSRRDLFKGAAVASGLVLGFHIGFRKLPFAEAAEPPSFEPNAFVSIDETGLVTIVASRSEMGTGIKTDLPLVLADELEADWNRVKIVQGQGDPKYGDQNTDGSRSTWQFFGPMRLAGATARQMLEAAAAQTWNVPVGECRAQNGFVAHALQRPQARLWRPRETRGDDAGAAAEPGAAKRPQGLALYRQAARDRRPRRISSRAAQPTASTCRYRA